MMLKLDLPDCSSHDIAEVLSWDDISINKFFFSLTQHMVTYISSRVVITVLRLIILTNYLKIS